MRNAPSRSRRAPIDGGFALLIVLWTLVLLSLLMSAIAASGSLRSRQAGDFRRNAALEAAADGGVDEAAFHLLDIGNDRWRADGRPYRVRRDGVTLTIRVTSEAGRVNPNRAQLVLLVALLQAVGANQRTAVAIASNIIAWRFPGTPGNVRSVGQDYAPPGAPLESIAELQLVPGMTPGLLKALAPHLTLFRDNDPDLAAADPVVRRALLAVAGTDTDPDAQTNAAPTPPDNSVVSVAVLAADAAGHRFERTAELLTGDGDDGGPPFRVVN